MNRVYFYNLSYKDALIASISTLNSEKQKLLHDLKSWRATVDI